MIHVLCLPLLSALPLLGATPPQEPVSALPDAEPALEFEGTLVPTDFNRIEIWPETWSGELLFLEVLPHGSHVEAGNVVARLDTRAIDEQIRNAEHDLESARLAHHISVKKAELEERAGHERIERAQRDFQRAQQSLDSFLEFELPMRERQQELQEQYSKDGLQDQKDELDQLRAMYEDDEITDATEDIVLKRSERQLERSTTGARLSAAQRKHQREFDWKMDRERRADDVAGQKRALDRQMQEFELDRLARHDRLARAERDLNDKQEKLEKLHRDRERLELRAPRAGQLLHGDVDAYRPGEAAPRHERGSRGQLRSALFCVADVRHMEVALKVGESLLAKVRQGQAVALEPVVPSDVDLSGTIRIEPFPLPDSARGPENQYAAKVNLDMELSGWAPGMRVKVKAESGS